MAKDMTWSETLQYQQSSLRWDIKRTMKSLCKRLADIGEECFVVSVNVNNGWVSHMGSIHGDDFIGENMHIPYNFLDYCRESVEIQRAESNTPEPASENLENNKEEGGDEGPRIAVQIVPHSDSDPESCNSDDDQKRKQGVVLIGSKNVFTKQKFPLKTSKVQPKQSPKRKSSVGRKPKDLKLHTDDETVKPQPVQGKSKLFRCTKCNQTFKHKGRYESHLQTESHKVNRNFTCYKCSARFNGVGDLYRHVKMCWIGAHVRFKQSSLL